VANTTAGQREPPHRRIQPAYGASAGLRSGYYEQSGGPSFRVNDFPNDGSTIYVNFVKAGNSPNTNTSRRAEPVAWATSLRRRRAGFFQRPARDLAARAAPRRCLVGPQAPQRAAQPRLRGTGWTPGNRGPRTSTINPGSSRRVRRATRLILCPRRRRMVRAARRYLHKPSVKIPARSP
jgi:hypothetical protein